MSFGTGNRLLDEVVLSFDGREISPSSRRLMQLVYDATAAVDWPKWNPSGNDIPAPVLRSVLTYCYLVGIAGSEEIEVAAVHDANVRYLCANHPLDWQTVRQFRRANQPALAEAISLAIGQLLEIPSAQARRLAAERLKRALQADSAAFDV